MIVSDGFAALDAEVLDSVFQTMTVAEATSKYDFTPTHGVDPYSTDWNRYCRSIGVYCYPTPEYVAGLAKYIGDKCLEIEAATGETARILEVGAGKGQLSFLLDKSLSESGIAAEILPIDNFSWSTRAEDVPTIADDVDALTGIHKYKPHIAVTAWPPIIEYDRWCRWFKEEPKVAEHIFIGMPELSMGRGSDRKIPAHVTDGFTPHEFEELRPLSLCYWATNKEMHPSRTFAFQRNSVE